MIFVGIDWAEHHHDVCLLDAEGGELEEQVNQLLDAHSDAAIVRSLPGLGGVVAARLGRRVR